MLKGEICGSIFSFAEMKNPLPPTLKSVLRFLLFLPLGLGQIPSFAQDTLPNKKLFIGFIGHYGFIAAHNKSMDYLIKGHIPAGELNFILQTNGEKHWEEVYKNPEKGLGIYFADLGNPEQLGYAMGIFPFVNFPLNPGRKFKLYIRTSDGIGIITKPYDRTNNHKNNINGSRINGFVNLRLNSVFYPGKNIRMETGIGLTHLSNGAWTLPNLGINIASVNLGISFMRREFESKKSNETANPKSLIPNPNYFFTVIAAAGVNQVSYGSQKRYASYVLYASGWKTVSEKSRFCVGADAFYNSANLAVAARDTIFDTSDKLNNLQAGVRLGYELVIGKIALPLETGAYLFTKTTSNGPLYHRIGVRYYLNRHLIINYSLKTHWVSAETYEFGLGYRF